MNEPVPFNQNRSGEFQLDLPTRLALLEQRLTAVESQRSDHELRIRAIEAAYAGLTAKLTIFAAIGSTVATGAMQLLLKGLG
jgi:hypothetical protein